MARPRELLTRIHPGRSDLAPVVLLHGSGQDENSLLDFARSACPDHTLIAARGRVPCENGYAFFRRMPDRTLDRTDLAEAAATIQDLLERLRPEAAVAPLVLGYSNGAIAAAAALAGIAASSSGAMLLRPLSPAPEGQLPDLDGYPVLLISGGRDARRSPTDGPLLDRQLRAAGARSTPVMLPTGHRLTADDVEHVARWVRSRERA